MTEIGLSVIFLARRANLFSFEYNDLACPVSENRHLTRYNYVVSDSLRCATAVAGRCFPG